MKPTCLFVAAALIWALAMLIGAGPARAVVRAPGQVRYATQDGQSMWQKTDVTFMTGAELNTATHSIDYDIAGQYAIVFFTQHEAAIIKSGGFSMCSMEFTSSCLSNFENFKGKDKGGREWEICTRDVFC